MFDLLKKNTPTDQDGQTEKNCKISTQGNESKQAGLEWPQNIAKVDVKLEIWENYKEN